MPKQAKNKTVLIGKTGFFIALAAGLAALVSGPGTNHGLWTFRTGITILRWSAYAGIAGAALSLVAFIASLRIVIVRNLLWALLGLVMGGSVIGIGLYWKHVAEGVPRIHDITTDTVNPPQFKAVLKLRRDNDNSPLYGGAEVAALQHKAYPDITPLHLPVPRDLAFEKALGAARKLGWQIIEAGKDTGRIEAVDTTFWFGFRDDIVIVVGSQGSGSRIDVRSASRSGLSDLGKNAERIRKFLHAVKEAA